MIIWGSIIEDLKKNNFHTSISIDDANEQCHLNINWNTNLDIYKNNISKYTSLVENSLC